MQGFAFSYIPGFSEEKFAKVEAWYAEYGAWILFAAALTPIPFKIFTIAGGALAQPLLPFVLAATVGRAAPLLPGRRAVPLGGPAGPALHRQVVQPAVRGGRGSAGRRVRGVEAAALMPRVLTAVR